MSAVRIRTARDAEPIDEALRLLSPRIRERVAHADWLAGVDPIFAGLHGFEAASYRNTAHACFRSHTATGRTTVVLPKLVEPWVVVHELGHVLHESVGFDTHDPDPCTPYATTDRWEAFAEAFTAWLCPETYADAQPTLMCDGATLALFEELSQ
jgi:hypothetical protein